MPSVKIHIRDYDFINIDEHCVGTPGKEKEIKKKRENDNIVFLHFNENYVKAARYSFD